MNVHQLQIVQAQQSTAPAHVLHRDYETRSRLDLKRVGAFKYAADPSTEVLCCAYAVDDSPVQLWKPGNPVPPEFVEAAANPGWLAVAHNAQFEMAVEQYSAAPRAMAGQSSRCAQQRCTLALCLMHALPGKLELAAEALCLAHQKDRCRAPADADDVEAAPAAQGRGSGRRLLV